MRGSGAAAGPRRAWWAGAGAFRRRTAIVTAFGHRGLSAVGVRSAELAAAALAAVVIGLALNAGGVHGPAWGWASVAVGAIGLLTVHRLGSITVSRRQLVPATALCALALWSGLSVFWAGSASPVVPSFERVALYAVLLVVLTVVVDEDSIAWLMDGLACGAILIDAVALWAKLFQPHAATSGAEAVNRLQTPFDYWNALGIFTGMAGLLALGRVLDGPPTRLRIALAGAVPVSLLVVYFTFSRGSFVAVAVGLVVMVMLPTDRRRRIVQSAGLAVPSGLLLLFAASQHQLARHPPSSDHPIRLHHWIRSAGAEGHEVALVLALAVAACCILTASWPKVEARVRANPAARKALTAAAALVVVFVLGGILVRVGSPVRLVSEGLGPLQQPPPPSHRDLNNRLASVSLNGRGRFWDAAWSDFTSHPVAGSGAGTFKRYWLQHRTVDANISDAHSFLLQTGAELGLVGVVLLLIVVGAALVAAFRAWRHPAVPALAAVFAAFLVHAASDRDWEVPAVACFALCVAAALVRLASGGDWIVIRGGARRALMIALAVVVAVGAWEFAGNLAMSRARVDLDHRSYGAARWKAELATWLAPWAAQGPLLQGRIAVATQDPGAASSDFSRAASRDGGMWYPWWQLAQHGPTAGRAAALARARRLDPLDMAALSRQTG